MPAATPNRRQQPPSAARRAPAVANAWQFLPWLVLSAGVHTAALGALFTLAPGVARTSVDRGVEVQVQPFAAQDAPAAPPPLPLPAPQPETATNVLPPLEPEATAHTIAAGDGEVQADQPGNASGRDSAFEGAQWNQVIGLGGNAGGKYGGRVEGRSSLVGSAQRAGKAIEDGLRWLAAHQDEDGRFDADGFMKHDTAGPPCDGPGNPAQDIGVTALALLAFLGDGSTPRAGPHKDATKRAVRWLLQQQQDSGLFGTRAANDYIYGHAIATYAICEAYGLADYSILEGHAQRAVDYLVAHRNLQAGWRYEPQAEVSDTSVTGWCLLALESARQFRLRVDPRALIDGAAFLDRVTDAKGRTGYTRKGDPSSRHAGEHETRFPPARGEALTAVALFCRLFLGQDPRKEATLLRSGELLLQKPPQWDEPALDFYYWFYGSCAMYQLGDRYWAEWSKRLGDVVPRHQRSDGCFAGSWDPVDAWGEDGGRVYSTAMLVLALQAHYRYGRFLAK